MTASYRFPKNFVWGTATAAAQIEGAAFEDGKGESVWDRFCRIPGKVVNGDTLDVACDHYHRYPQDFALMQKLGIKNYRMSVAWPRIYPNGDSSLNQTGLDFYNRLIDTALKHEITPWVTFYHWDLPQALEDLGGWRVRAIPERFSIYANTLVKTLGDRVKNWITLNEIPCFIGLSYEKGEHAPGARESAKVVNQAYHHALLAHGYAVQAVREFGGRRARVGLTHNPDIAVPVIENEVTIDVAQTCFARDNAHILAPIYQGRYPTEYLRRTGANRPVWQKGDFELISQPTDFLGLNVYSGYFVRPAAKGKGHDRLPFPPQYPQAAQNWLLHVPQCIYWVMRHCKSLYGVNDFYITENGAGYDEELNSNGEVYDLHRRDYVRNYLVNVHRAISEGYGCRGYFLWSFIDNYEWAWGYGKRFGIVYNDFKTQKRTPKLSAQWYSEVIRENRVV
jgi:beta-glucosidase